MPSDLIRAVVVCLKGRIMDSSCSNSRSLTDENSVDYIRAAFCIFHWLKWTGYLTILYKQAKWYRSVTHWLSHNRKQEVAVEMMNSGNWVVFAPPLNVNRWRVGAMWANALPKKPGDNWNTNPDFLTFHPAYALNIVSCWSSCLSGILTKVPGKRKQGIVEKVVKRVAVGKIGEH